MKYAVEVIIAIVMASGGIYATWWTMRRDTKAEARTEAVRVNEDFKSARQSELDALDARRRSLDDRERWFFDEQRKVAGENRQRLDTLEARFGEQDRELSRLRGLETQLRNELENLANTLTALKLQNDHLKRENARIPALESRIAELERKTNGAHV